MINTTERNITATLSTHLSLSNLKAKKRPQGNGRGKRAKFAFVQDNGEDKQRWKKETSPRVSGAFRLIDETGYCLWANAPEDFKRNKNSAFVTAIPTAGQKGKCTFWKKEASGDGWNIVMARPGTKQGQSKYSNMNGWGLAVLGWCNGGDCELGADRMYLALHKKEKKFSIWTSRIFAAPPSYLYTLEHGDDNDTADGNDTADANSTDNATDTSAAGSTPATPAPAAPAAGAAAGGAAAPANATNGTNASKKSKSKKKKAKKLPEPNAGDNSDDDAAGKDLSWDIDPDEDFDDYEFREKIEHASEMHELPAGFLHVKFLKWLHLFNGDDE